MTSDRPALLPPAFLALQVRRWDVETGKVLQEAQLHEKQISDMQVRGAGQRRGRRPSGGKPVVAGRLQGGSDFWRRRGQSGSYLGWSVAHSGPGWLCLKMPRPVPHPQMSVDGTHFITASPDRTSKLVDTQVGQPHSTVPHATGISLP